MGFGLRRCVPLRRAVAPLLVVCAALLGGGLEAAAQASGRVLVTTVKGAITPVIADHLRDGVARAERDGYEAFVVRLDTPGGLDSSMREIVQGFLAADVPVVVYVSPSGARAASAGAIITFAAHIAAMAPGTAIGAATPVELQGGDVDRKVVNDAAAFAESIAEVRGRDVEFAVDTVREGRSASAVEAAEIGAVDLLAASLPDLLKQIDGRTVVVGDADRDVVLHTAGAALDEYELGLFRRIQQRLADPNLAFLFMSIGTLGLIYELATPGMGAGGVLGVSCILLGLFGLAILPVNAVGVLFLLLAAALFVVEVLAPGIGVAAAGGVTSLVLGGIFLVRDTPGMEVSVAVVAPVALVVGGAVVVAGRFAMRARRSPSLTGAGALTGQEVIVSQLPGGPRAFVAGAWWNVRSVGGDLADDARGRVVGLDGLDLLVERIQTETDQSSEAENQ